MKTLFLDLDGVFADFEGHYLNTFGTRHSDDGDDLMWDNIIKKGDFFVTAPLFENALGFLDILEEQDHVDLKFLTSCGKRDYHGIAWQKKDWVRNVLKSDLFVLPVPAGSSKALFIHEKGDLLVDDFVKNLRHWDLAGGVGIHHTGNFYETLRKIFNAINS
jgi:hypothetical protein